MSQLLRRFNAVSERIEDQRNLGRILMESQVAEQPGTVARATLPGDPFRLRGIPICARGVGGVSPGTNPVAALLRSVR